MKKLALLLPALLFSSPALSAHVKSPGIHKGEFEIHNTSTWENDSEDAFENELEFEYGFTDSIGGLIAVVSEDHDGENFDVFTAAEFAVKLKLAEEGKHMPEAAVYLGYEYTEENGEADEIFALGTFEKNFGKLENIINLRLANQVGGGNEGGIEFDLNARSAYQVHEQVQLGVEYFGHFGEIGGGYGWNEQGHLLGPVVLVEPIDHLHTSLAFLAGISDDAPESAIKLEVGYHF